MLYDFIIIDTANLFYRLLDQKKDDTLNMTKKLVNHIENEAKKHLRNGGQLYLVFDPIGKSTLNEEKTFHVATYSSRKAIDPHYKSGRTYSPLYKQSIENLQKYYAYRGEAIKEVYSNYYEADDFIEPIVLSLPPEAEVALVSTDEDWCKAIGEHVHLINGSYDSPFKKQDFFAKFGFMPTPAANILYKSLFGDTSDGIQGCIFLRKAKFLSNIRKTCFEAIKSVSENGITIDDFIKQFKSFDFKEIVMHTEHTPIEQLFIEFTIAAQREDVIGKLYKNIMLVRSQLDGKNIDKFIHSQAENKKFNDMIEQAIFGVVNSKWFGRR